MTASSKSKTTSLDSILMQIGDFGKYQICVFSLICFAIVLHSAVHVAFVFTALDLDYRCDIPSCQNLSSNSNFEPDWLKLAVPFDEKKKPAKCERFVEKFVNISSFGVFFNCSANDFDLGQTIGCDKFVYRTGEESILTEYNLHCPENLWKLTMVGTVNNIGQFFGLFVSGLISDKFGRKIVLVWGMTFCAICGLVRTLMPTYELFLLFELLDAAFGSGTYICGFVLGAELVGPKKRVLTGTLASSCYAVGEVFTASVAWLVQSWKSIIYITYTPIFLLLSYLWLIPESVRWNLSKNRFDEVKATLRQVAKHNGRDLCEMQLQKLCNTQNNLENKFDENSTTEKISSNSSSINSFSSRENILKISNKNLTKKNLSEKPKNPFLQVFRSTPLLLRLINCCFCWITCTFLFYGLTLNSVTLAGNNYLDFILTALVEIPAYFVCAVVVEKYGRKRSLIGAYLLTGGACLAFIFVPQDSEWGSLCIYLIGKFGATASFTVLYVLTSEMFPTTMRHSLMGICSTFGRCGSMISPQTPLLAHIWAPLPLVSFAGMSIIAGLLTMLFPETLNKQLPDTIEEAVNIGRSGGGSGRSNNVEGGSGGGVVDE